ncbi:hypothetical protein VP01_4513g1, partial [Puccinia sorghi]
YSLFFQLPGATSNGIFHLENTVQYLWQTSVLSKSSFVKALCGFLDSRTTTEMYACGGQYKKRSLLIPFSHSVNLYSCVILLQRSIYLDGFSSSPTARWANKCPQFFGSKEGEQKANEAKLDIIMVLEGNFQQCHYAYASKENPPKTKYPHAFTLKIASNAAVFTETNSSAEGINISSSCSRMLCFYKFCLPVATHTRLQTIPEVIQSGKNVMTTASLTGKICHDFKLRV